MGPVNILIDTNIALYFLSGDKKLAELFDNTAIYLSFVTELELLAYPALSEKEQNEVLAFLDDCTIIDLNNRIKRKAIAIRKKTTLKLPDALIAATAISKQLPFISADKDFEGVEDLVLFSYEQ